MFVFITLLSSLFRHVAARAKRVEFSSLGLFEFPPLGGGIHFSRIVCRRFGIRLLDVCVAPDGQRMFRFTAP